MTRMIMVGRGRQPAHGAGAAESATRLIVDEMSLDLARQIVIRLPQASTSTAWA